MKHEERHVLLERVTVLTQVVVRTTPADGPQMEVMQHRLRLTYKRITFTVTQKEDKDGSVYCMTTITIQLLNPTERAKLLAEQRIREACDEAKSTQVEIDFIFPGEDVETGEDDISAEAADRANEIIKEAATAEASTTGTSDDVPPVPDMNADKEGLSETERAGILERISGTAVGTQTT